MILLAILLLAVIGSLAVCGAFIFATHIEARDENAREGWPDAG